MVLFLCQNTTCAFMSIHLLVVVTLYFCVCCNKYATFHIFVYVVINMPLFICLHSSCALMFIHFLVISWKFLSMHDKMLYKYHIFFIHFLCCLCVWIFCTYYAFLIHFFAAHLQHFNEQYNFFISQITQPLTNHDRIFDMLAKTCIQFVIGFIKSHSLSFVCYIDWNMF